MEIKTGDKIVPKDDCPLKRNDGYILVGEKLENGYYQLLNSDGSTLGVISNFNNWEKKKDNN